MEEIKTKEEIALKKAHDKICQTCDGCSKSRCAFTLGYHRGRNEYHKEVVNGLDSEFIKILSKHCGEHGQNESAQETLERIIRERDLLLKKAVNEILKPAHY
jgi:hypothetical protein